jgi:hypothetical protein
MGLEIKTSPAWPLLPNSGGAIEIFLHQTGLLLPLQPFLGRLPGFWQRCPQFISLCREFETPCLQFGNGCRGLGISGHQPGQRRHEKEIRSSA